MFKPESRPATPADVVVGFSKQRLTILPDAVVERCRTLPLVESLFVTHIGSFRNAPSHFVKRLSGAPQHILLYCIEGKGRLQVFGRSHVIEAGNAVVIPANHPHLYRAKRNTPWSLFWIHFDGSQSARVAETLGLSPKQPILLIPDTDRILNAFEAAYSCTQYNYTDAGLQALSAAFLQIVSAIKLHEVPTHRDARNSEARAMETLRFMQQNLHRDLGTADFAERAAQSVPHYTRIIREKTNQSPLAFFIRLKIRKACDLLYETNLSVKDIAQQLGYSDPISFTRIFKKSQGYSPRRYREILAQYRRSGNAPFPDASDAPQDESNGLTAPDAASPPAPLGLTASS